MIFCAATPDDVPILLDFIRELAAFEQEPDAVKMTPAQLHGALFGEKPRAEALLVKIDGLTQAAALWFESFNTWTGKPGLYVEDIFVRPAARGKGIGRAIFAYLARVALDRDYARMEWMVLNWNEAAIKFYNRLGGEPLADWTKFRLSGDALQTAAAMGA
jgi:GNAT superfamily N-acetyltransferase